MSHNSHTRLTLFGWCSSSSFYSLTHNSEIRYLPNPFFVFLLVRESIYRGYPWYYRSSHTAKVVCSIAMGTRIVARAWIVGYRMPRTIDFCDLSTNSHVSVCGSGCVPELIPFLELVVPTPRPRLSLSLPTVSISFHTENDVASFIHSSSTAVTHSRIQRVCNSHYGSAWWW